MLKTCLPTKIEEFLLDVAADHSQRSTRMSLLRFNGEADMRDTFLTALISPDIEVHVSVCDDDMGPEEICVRAQGDDHRGTYWSDLPIILLAPRWADLSGEAEELANDIVEHWDTLRAIANDIVQAA